MMAPCKDPPYILHFKLEGIGQIDHESPFDVYLAILLVLAAYPPTIPRRQVGGA